MTTHGNINHAMRDNYSEFGVDEYYRKVASSYRNPFFPGIRKAVWALLNRWWHEEGSTLYVGEGAREQGWRVLDMAAGSGEATISVLDWENAARGEAKALPSVIDAVSTPTPTQPARQAFIPPALQARMAANNSNAKDPPNISPSVPRFDISATDPYTVPAYVERTSRPCHPLSFTDLAGGQIPPDSSADGEGVIWDMIICSFALHLVPDQQLFPLCYELSTKARWLVVLAPHKKPELKETWGWARWDIAGWKPAGEKLYRAADTEEETELEIVRDKVKLRLYRSTSL